MTKIYKISEEQAKALAESISIWFDRKEGIKNDAGCPLCIIRPDIKCGDCIIFQDTRGCGGTEFYEWNIADCKGHLADMKKYGTLMYNRLVRLQSESETFTIVDK